MKVLQRSRYFINCFLLLTAFCHSNAQEKRNPLAPDFVKLQYAGNIGFVSIGAGYANRKEKLEAGLYYGYTPESQAGYRFHALTAKLEWLPFRLNYRSIEISPLNTGLLCNYTFSSEATDTHFGHPAAWHGGIYIGSIANLECKPGKTIKKTGIYYELVAFDTDLMNYLSNKESLSLRDVLSIGIGFKCSFR